MFVTLLLCLAADPAALDSVQGDWVSADGIRLVIDGHSVTVIGRDG